MNKGFTLIELIVSVGLFGVAVLLGVGLLMSLTSVQNKVISIREAQDNLGFALEVMTKEIRIGDSYSDSFGDSTFTFTSAYDTNADGHQDVVTYSLQSDMITKSIDGGAFLPITASEVKVENLEFYVFGNNDPLIQPMVIVVMKVIAGERITSELNLQTAISQRSISI